MGRPAITKFSTLTNSIEFVTRWTKAEGRGSAERYQLRLYCINVAIAMGMPKIEDELQCLHCGLMFNVFAMGDCDRIIPDNDYRPGNVVMTCRNCNETRGHLQFADKDFRGIARLAADVLAASATVSVPSLKAGREAYKPSLSPIRQRTVTVAAWILYLSRSPYWNE